MVRDLRQHLTGDYDTIVSTLGAPDILVHGVALKPGKPLCLGAVGRTPVVVLPGFPTSAVFTFQEFAVPVIRALAGLPAREEAVRAALSRLGVEPPPVGDGPFIQDFDASVEQEELIPAGAPIDFVPTRHS